MFGKRLETLTRPTTSSGYSLTHFLAIRLRILLKFLIETILEARLLFVAHKITRQVDAIGGGRAAIVIGGGPSTKQLAIDKVKTEQKAGRLDVFVVNAYALTSLASELEPNYYVLSDPAYLPSSKTELKGLRVSLVWDKLKTWKHVRLILPHSWQTECVSIQDQVVVWFDNRELPGWSKSSSPLRPRGYLSATAHTALAVAKYMDYSEIYLIGFDHSVFRQLHVDLNNKLFEGPGHFYESGKSADLALSSFYPNGLADALHAYSLLSLDLRRVFSTKGVINLSPNSFIDVFDKVKESTFLNKGED